MVGYLSGENGKPLSPRVARALRRMAAGGVLAALTVPLFVSVSGAQQPKDTKPPKEVDVKVVAGYSGKAPLGSYFPATVSVTSQKLRRLVVTARASSDSLPVTGPAERVEIEVPAGTTKTFTVMLGDGLDALMTLKAGLGFGEAGNQGFPRSVKVVVADASGKRLTSATSTAQSTSDTLVGVLPAVGATARNFPDLTLTDAPGLSTTPSDGGDVPIAVDVGGGATPTTVAGGPVVPTGVGRPQGVTFYRVNPEGSSRPTWAGLDQIVATTADLARLNPIWRASLIEWVARGGRLVIDSPAGSAADPLPASWRNGGTAVAYFGGIVRYTNGAASAGRWADVVVRTSSTATRSGPDANGFTTMSASQLRTTMARASGVNIPSGRAQALVLLIYVAFVGPLLFWFLARRRRQPLAWILIPVISVIAVAAGWIVTAASVNSQTSVRVLADAYTGGQRTSVDVLGVPRRHEVPSMRFGAGTFVDLGGASQFGLNQSSFPTGEVLTSRTSVDLTPSVSLGDYALGRGISSASAGSDTPPTIDAKREASTGEIVGTVKNDGDHDLVDAVVITSDGLGQPIGTVKAKSSATFRLKAALPSSDQGAPVDGATRAVNKAWNVRSTAGLYVQPTAAASSEPKGAFDMVTAQIDDLSSLSHWVGVAGFSGPTDGELPAVIGQGRPRTLARLVLARAELPRGNALPGWKVSAADGSGAATVRFELAARKPGTQLRLIAPVGFQAVPQVWSGGAWHDLTEHEAIRRNGPAGANVPAGPVSAITDPRPQSSTSDTLVYPNLDSWAVPEDAVADGTLYVRVQGGESWYRPVQLVEEAR